MKATAQATKKRSRGHVVEVSNAFGEMLEVPFIAANALEPHERAR